MSSRQSKSLNTTDILDPVAHMVSYLQNTSLEHYKTQHFDTIKTYSKLESLITDIPLLDAIKGYIELRQDHLENAEFYFSKSLELEPSFGEVHAYYSLLMSKLGRQKEAEEHKKKAEEYKMAWILD